MEDDAAERARKKREYIRTFMQEYRGKNKKEKDVLLAQIDRLEARIVAYRKKLATGATTRSVPPPESAIKALSWRNVAMAVAELQHETTTEQRALVRRTREYEDIARELKSWVTFSTHVMASPSPHRATWRDMTLLAHPTSRRLGKQWITQQMYHNKDRLFEQYNMPSSANTQPFNAMEIDFREHGYFFVQRMASTWHAPLETIVELYRHHTGSMFTVDGFYPLDTQVHVEETETTSLHQYAPTETNPMFINLLCGEFRDDDGRCVLVIQQIQSDEAASEREVSCRQRSRMVWVELTREAEHVTRERFLGVVSHEMASDGRQVSMEETSRSWGFDLSAVDHTQREAMFLRAYRAVNNALRGPRQAWYQGILADRTTKLQVSTDV
ncbi:Aste57867_10461 [Aphanomyces stellatus]|uniref:Aste57867_10461 protein n=1 Tax=Aphanomyces stellatus TaxID=120398 RepID=A0A485KQI2_9STRA|nr:hypothetical protein As57867_010421 [Aphanomyces stellatus]VFT87335.1 Aste57867_10461 [Aphanomyces stellatus]